MNETINQMNEVIVSLTENLAKASKGNKSAAARARKDTLKLTKLGRDFRKQSIAEAKQTAE